MNIRKISADDTLQLRRDVLYPNESLDAVKVDHDADGLHFGVFDQGQLVTVVSLFLGRDSAQFRKLATAQAAQGKGFGEAILAHLADICKKEKIKLLWCNARDTAVTFYDRLGYTTKGDYFIKGGITFVRMELPLDQQNMTTKKFEIIPAIDIIGGKCVRLTQGDYNQQKVYNEHPLEVAKEFEAIGVRRLHLVDLDGAKKGAVVNWKVLESIAGKTGLVTDFGGGIKTDKDLEIVFQSGAALATIGSVAVKQPELFFSWVKQYGADKIFLGADVKEEKIAVGGWLETTELSVFDFLESNIARGVTNIFCTDIAKDGLLQGPSIDLYKKIIERFPGINFVASGGVSNIEDVAALQEIGCSGAIIGKAIYEGNISMDALKTFL
ncbi:1-(5-phosphoribosyl)-5-[(5-phosphoribosylamino)methylideneamino]imidazole-4-carboxamide isomerase [Chitinophaga ginsengisegetis]|uniref:1-(5-phosphoribosyl)-5-[(5- phosphoribosylamino)methylideneamino]imidazole-4- carboxamide isomerase n=1 Tax=Chitinophaga ginsengisegetis TaxID=393003 RepID=UPI000DB901D5|nr:1-(5-phosphoribosyl)-5-[(5-phosphoribosylamino)methylideneamino]imidazole-4-carboxamide isomerase [Chitinophaga ginsengisegetis]MDR6566973.1 phosphoribosylformimino-5-aminoimidazole carboxamide ribotide isomerase [Chitinophaga ginsengisegetis]MDR6646703.1 phosphoribosylformimino-5-aminoimidazole carboxamide ribotide isomerase [Chitinophaga ginsengisegetis]MDR6653053.1 phosphoribosylformimino-5-aminoimidazole carboxamide ribotide isomerase [Chitinophaga ginsengisegetis]